jgi:hypothetical protein
VNNYVISLKRLTYKAIKKYFLQFYIAKFNYAWQIHRVTQKNCLHSEDLCLRKLSRVSDVIPTILLYSTVITIHKPSTSTLQIPAFFRNE